MSKKLEELVDAIFETDFLIIGGGLVGSMAALRAKKNDPNVDVIIIDKARMEFSGDGIGLDNFNQVPLHKEDVNKEVKNDDVDKAVFGAKRFKGLKNYKLDQVQMKNSYISQPLLEEVGVRIREDDGSLQVLQGYRKGTVWGRIERDENGKPYEPLFGTFSRATDLKMNLGTAVRKNGTRVFDRTMLTSLVTRDGKAVGATAVNTRTGEFLYFKAKVILLATGSAARLYPYPWAPYPNRLFYILSNSVNHGGGHICAMNAGAKLFGMEMGKIYNVSKGMNHSSGGGACNWFFKMYNSKGECLEDKYPDKNVTKAGGVIPGINYLYAPDMNNAEVEKDVILSPKNNATPDEIAAVYFTAATEPPRALKFHKLAGGLTNERPAECVGVLPGIGQGNGGVLRENEYSETSVKNLFAAGNVTGNGTSFGFTWGCLIADHAIDLIKDQNHAAIDVEQLEQVAATKEKIFAPLNRKTDYTVNPLELEDYIRQINYDYIGLHKIKPKLERAVELIRFARTGAVPLLTAKNPHELMRAIEVQDIIDISEMHASSSIIRNESRLIPQHYREDFPETDENWEGKIVTAIKVAGEFKYDIEYLNK